MKKKAAALALGALAAVLLAGCGSKLDVDKNTVALQKNGKVLEASVEDFSQSYYDEEELNAYIGKAVGDYTAENGEKTVKVTDSRVEEKTAYLTLQYESADVFSDFTGTECFAGSIVEAQAAGYSFDTEFYPVEDQKAAGETVSAAQVLADDDLKAFILRSDSDIRVPGRIAYVSADGTSVSDDDTVAVEAKESDADESALVYVLYK